MRHVAFQIQASISSTEINLQVHTSNFKYLKVLVQDQNLEYQRFLFARDFLRKTRVGKSDFNEEV